MVSVRPMGKSWKLCPKNDESALNPESTNEGLTRAAPPMHPIAQATVIPMNIHGFPRKTIDNTWRSAVPQNRRTKAWIGAD